MTTTPAKKAPAKKAPAKKAPARATAGNRAQRRAAAKKPTAPAAQNRRTREIQGVTVLAVDFDGETYWIAEDFEDWDMRAAQAIEDDKFLTALKYALESDERGRPGYEVLTSKGYRIGQLEAFLREIAAIIGIDISDS